MAEDFNIYADVMRKYPVLSKEEERDMIAKWRHDEPKLRELLVLHNLRGAISLGSTYYAKILGSNETIQLAVEGLIKAAEKFDLDRDVKFLSFALWVMRTTISHEALAPDSLVCYAAMSMDQRIKEDEESTFGDFILRNNVSVGYKGGNILNADDVIRAADGDDVHFIFSVIDGLNCPRDWKELTKEYFNLSEWGFNDDSFKSFAEIGKRRGETRQNVALKVRRVITMAREKLTGSYSSEELVLVNQRRDPSKAMGRYRCRHRKSTFHHISKRLSLTYERISNEGLRDTREGSLKCLSKLKISFYGAGFGSFYSDRYMSIARAYLRDCKDCASKDELIEGCDESVIENLIDETKHAKEEIEYKITEGDRLNFNIGAVEDDGAEDYEVD